MCYGYVCMYVPFGKVPSEYLKEYLQFAIPGYLVHHWLFCKIGIPIIIIHHINRKLMIVTKSYEEILVPVSMRRTSHKKYKTL